MVLGKKPHVLMESTPGEQRNKVLFCRGNELKGKAMHRITTTLFSIISLAFTLVHGAELKYSIAPDFFEEKPGGQPLGPCHGGVVFDKAGNIYVSTDTERGMVVFSAAGKFLRATGPTRIHGLELRAEKGVESIYA